jgi:hypothetical protein
MGNGEGIFAAHAERLRSYGLAVLPCDGKVPLVKWKTLTRPLSKATVEKLGTKHPTANIGFIPDLSGLVVVDVDDAAQVAEVEHIFGQTPVRARTSRGMHLYFGARKDQQIAACNLRSLGIEGEVKTGRCNVIAPPSQHPDTGWVYAYEGSGLDALRDIPPFDADKLYKLRPEAATSSGSRKVRDGSRKLWLNDRLCAEVMSCDTFDELLDVARTRNAEIPVRFFGKEPKPDAIVVQVAQAVWAAAERGHLEHRIGGQAAASISRQEWKLLTTADRRRAGDSLLLLTALRFEHTARCRRGETFVLVTEAMARTQYIEGWNWKQYLAPIRILCATGLLLKVKEAWGKKPAEYTLGKGRESSLVTLSPDLGGHPKGHARQKPSGAHNAFRAMQLVSTRRCELLLICVFQHAPHCA